jgi:hypothetical protein
MALPNGPAYWAKVLLYTCGSALTRTTQLAQTLQVMSYHQLRAIGCSPGTAHAPLTLQLLGCWRRQASMRCVTLVRMFFVEATVIEVVVHALGELHSGFLREATKPFRSDF